MLAEGLAALLGQGAHLADVGAGHEGLFTAAGDDQSADIRVRLYGGHQLVQVGQDLGIQRVQRLGTVDGRHGDEALLFQQNVGHIKFLLMVPFRERSARKRHMAGGWAYASSYISHYSGPLEIYQVQPTGFLLF